MHTGLTSLTSWSRRTTAKLAGLGAAALLLGALANDRPQAAQRLALEVQADANLAEAKARSAKAQKTAAALGEGKRVLREELQRVTP